MFLISYIYGDTRLNAEAHSWKQVYKIVKVKMPLKGTVHEVNAYGEILKKWRCWYDQQPRFIKEYDLWEERKRKSELSQGNLF